MNKFKWIVGLLLAYSSAQAQRQQFPDVLDVRYAVKDTGNVTATFFSDQGAWHAYALPVNRQVTGFTGPLLMDMKGEWLSDMMARLRIYEEGRELLLQQTDTATRYYPGMLQLVSSAEGIQVQLQLVFSDNRQAMLQALVHNTQPRHRQLTLQWEGSAALKRAVLHPQENGLQVTINGTAQQLQIRYGAAQPWQITLAGNSYKAVKTVTIPANGHILETQTQSYYLENKEVPATITMPDAARTLAANEQRWNGYLQRLWQRMPFPVSDTLRSRLAVKSMVTLITNWRSAARQLLHDGVFPSASYQGFYGFWSWDSWKQAVALAYFEPALAASNIRTLFAYQQPDGMIPDCIYTDSSENNHRDTKPPLAAWAVWEVFKTAGDTAFLRSMYDPLCRYHEWWYKDRDHDGNGLCEYGATDGTRIAAAWESGMDNAVRFDKAAMLQNHPGAWSLNQESVDLNSYLYKEKMILAQIARQLGLRKAAQQWQQQAVVLKKKTNQAFYDATTAYYYDRTLAGNLIRVKGPEAWIPLWAGIATKEQAAGVTKQLKDTAVFNTLVPLPVLDASEKAFDPQRGYWRGPVWLDQFYFAIAGLQTYGAHQQAVALSTKLWQHAEGMQGKRPLYENYHPHTGKGLNAPNFSWTAAHVLMLLAAQQ
ncbi:MGH1-like glycoside hydrolase domain-containing protein [Chitinophaga nivalis]|uniref:Trehalase family glycosidase n=1 Tax=Chitinophaga nivalis TaxID=2991709 RepID=A0ABT3INV5_9BACT|nr:trehalase family glycosidase [Chitinophaga nivalis]MCW3464647.1 trehalase family glycosidase [Chitinophaga nivalis]MCW3485662.1 trehalase family glycosidase [Chitinophaga nivalis]